MIFLGIPVVSYRCPFVHLGTVGFASGTTCLVVTLKMSHVGSQLDLKVAQNIDKTAARYNMA